MNPRVDGYFKRAKRWKEELENLRAIVLSSPLTEELKWGKPCYTYRDSNLVILYALKESCAVGFLKGVLLKDPKGVLIAPGENSQSVRWIKFNNSSQIAEMETVLKDYIDEAIEVQKAGLEVNYKKASEFVIPDELKKSLARNPDLNAAFQALTPGRQRGYILYFSAAKQAATREGRIEKCRQQILDGKGIYDDFRDREKRHSKKR